MTGISLSREDYGPHSALPARAAFFFFKQTRNPRALYVALGCTKIETQCTMWVVPCKCRYGKPYYS